MGLDEWLLVNDLFSGKRYSVMDQLAEILKVHHVNAGNVNYSQELYFAPGGNRILVTG